MDRGRFCYFSLLRSGRVSWFYGREGTEIRQTDREGSGSGRDLSRWEGKRSLAANNDR
jgi:hypothetical protein